MTAEGRELALRRFVADELVPGGSHGSASESSF